MTRTKGILAVVVALALLIPYGATQFQGITVLMATPLDTVTLINNGNINSSFIEATGKFDCSLSPLYTYGQTVADYLNNTAYSLSLFAVSEPISVVISTAHGNFMPSFNPSSCFLNCSIVIQNNCEKYINFFNYFDRVIIHLNPLGIQLSFYVLCNDEFITNTFEWGMIVEIVVVTIVLCVVALYSRAWSLGGLGFTFNLWWVIAFNVILIVGAIIGYHSYDGINICLNVVTFGLGILGVGICANQLLFLLKLSVLKKVFFKRRSFQFRILQVVSLLLGTGTVLGWFYSDHNIFLTDIVCMCMVVGLIKILKFTSLKMAGLAFLVLIVVQLVIATLIFVFTQLNYNNLFLNSYNYPFELQMPTLNPVYNQKCSWMPITVLIFPGMLFSYLRRFDTCRSTKMYLIIGTVTFFIGGIAWMFISVVSPIQLPFGLISEFFMFGLICLFAFRRREIRVLWDGKFYDEEFTNREQLNVALEMVRTESRTSTKTIESHILQQLMENTVQEQSQSRSEGGSAARERLLRGITNKNL